MNDGEPYIVLVGDVGSGKSTLFEKLTGSEGRSSSSQESFTRESAIVTVPGVIKICDTPGSNAMEDSLLHNVWIAKAINYQPVSKLLFVVKATTRIDNVLTYIGKYLDNFIDFPEEILGICITHMDKVHWNEQKMRDMLEGQEISNSVVFSQYDTNAEVLQNQILQSCGDPFQLKIDDQNFLKIF